MKRFAIALLLWASLCRGQKPQKAEPGWTSQQLELMNTGSDLRDALQAIEEKPRQTSESVLKEVTCGRLFVYTPGTKDSKGNEVLKNLRTTFDGQKPERIAFCWLNEARRRFAAEEVEARDHPEIDQFIKDVQLAMLTEPDSVYLKLVGVYCSNGGTFYTSLTGTVSELLEGGGRETVS